MDIPTPVARFSNVVGINQAVTLTSAGKVFHFNIERSNLQAVNGSFRGESNRLQGEIVVDGEVITIDAPLNPDFSQGGFDATYQCTANLRGLVPVGH
jgi:hypothetical protein